MSPESPFSRPPRRSIGFFARALHRARLGAAVLLLVPGVALADYCEERVRAALASLQGEGSTQVGQPERERTLSVLMSLCQDAVQAGGGQAPSAGAGAPANSAAAVEAGAGQSVGTPEAAPSQEAGEEEERVKILGMEIERAEPGSPGHERLRTKR